MLLSGGGYIYMANPYVHIKVYLHSIICICLQTCYKRQVYAVAEAQEI